MKINVLFAITVAVAICTIGAQSDAQKLDIKPHISGLFSKIFGTVDSALHLKELSNNIKEDAFIKFMQAFNRTYASGPEFADRFKIFRDNVKKIIKSKIEFLEGRKSYTLGINSFADMTEEELKQRMGLISPLSALDTHSISNQTLSVSQFLKKNNRRPLPSKFDWRDERPECVLQPSYQGKCGSCYSFAIMSVMETMRCLKTGKAERLSTQMLVDCGKLYGYTNGCNGARPDKALEFLTIFNVLALDRDYPYTAKEGTCQYKKLLYNGKLMIASERPKFRYIMENGQEMLNLLVNNGPLITVLAVPPLDFTLYSGGIITDTKNYEELGGHGVTLIGYGYDKYLDKEYWIIKNSWGTQWGEGGFARIERGVNAFGIESLSFASTN